jgi:RNA polymerase sigma factor (sigma-70 family)
MITDAALLRNYVEKRDERAFAELVQRHLDVVYSAALRRTRGQTHLAEEISQKVFCDLSRKAAALMQHPTLTGWLHRSTRYAAIDAARAELRRQKLQQTLTAMPDTSPASGPRADWEQLRPVIDEAMDQLDDRDRELMLLHYFNALTFAEVGARMKLSEDAARKRVSRALDKLRGHLGRRGVTSTTAALGLLLSHPPLVAAPAGLASTVTATALAIAPTGLAGTTFSLLFMSKLTAPIVSAALAAGLTGLVWTSTAADTVSAAELAALREENTRLVEATAAEAPLESVARVASEYSAQAAAIARALGERRGRQITNSLATSGAATAPPASPPAVTPRGHYDHGTATARDAAMTFAWASDIGDPEVLGQLLYLDASARAKASEILATMPEAIRAQYPTPEAFYGLLMAASCLEAPPPGADILGTAKIVELQPGRVALQPTGIQFQQTPDGWKHALPLAGVQGLPNVLNSQTLAKLAATAQP